MLLQVDVHGEQPLYEQLRDQIVTGIASGQLRPGEPLPSVRRLGADLGINLHTVNKAYAILRDQGYLALDRRQGAAVAATLRDSDAFRAVLTARLRLGAAEARCHGWTESDFLAACREAYGTYLSKGGTNDA